MANIQLVRRRIKSAKSVSQITKAMEMVAVSKLKRAQAATLRSRTYAIDAREALARLRRQAAGVKHSLWEGRAVGGKRLLIVFSSDRGLAGAYNANILRALLKWLQEQTVTPAPVVVVGQKAARFVGRLPDLAELLSAYTDWPAQPKPEEVRPIVQLAKDRFLAGEVAAVDLLYTDFVSTLRQNVVSWQLLPVSAEQLVATESAWVSEAEVALEPSPRAVLDFIVPRLVEVQVYQAALEASASEQAMRMMAMKAASDNAKDLIDDLTLTYNGVRQAAITQELAEISAGAGAIS